MDGKLSHLFLCLSLAAAVPAVPAGDGDGASVRPEREVRIFSTAATATHILLKLGAKDQLKAIEYHGAAVPGAAAIPVIARNSAVSQEKLLELGINAAVLWYYQADLRQLLESRRIPCLVLPPPRLKDYPQTIRQLGELTGRIAEAERLIAEFKRSIPLPPPPEQRRPRVYLELYAPGRAVRRESYLGDLLELAGGENIAAGLPEPGRLSSEMILERQPEVIFYIEGFATPDEIAARPGFSALPAVQARRIHPIDRLTILEGADPAAAVTVLRDKLLTVE